MGPRSKRAVVASVITAAVIAVGGFGRASATTGSPDGSQLGAPATLRQTWTAQQLVDRSECVPLVLTIDVQSRSHVAAECDGSIRYWTSTGDGTWRTTPFAHPTGRREIGPQVATDGNVVYVAYTRVAVTVGGCGDNGLRDVGVYYRQRRLPSGIWSSAKRMGQVDDHLQSFRVVGGTLHATVLASNGLVYYEALKGTDTHRYLVPGAVGESSLRVGSDGRVRIAYEAAGSLRYAVFTGSRFATSRIAGSTGGYAPQLVLGRNNAAYVVWTRAADNGRGCTGPGPDPSDGTYFGTTASGHWVSGRFTTAVGQASLTVEVATGRVHAVMSNYVALNYFTKTATGGWIRTSLAGKHAQWPVIRQDPATGRLEVVYLAGSANSGTPSGIYAVTTQ